MLGYIKNKKIKFQQKNSIRGIVYGKKNYSAGMVKLSFWVLEFKKRLQLVNSWNGIRRNKKLNLESIYFAAPTQARAIQMYNTYSMRLKALDRSFTIYSINWM
jgi:hypothetical protein